MWPEPLKGLFYKMNHKKMSPISFFALRLDLMRNGVKIGSGTGFVYQPEGADRKFLVTNYHVISARDPKEPHKSLPGLDSPDQIQFSFLRRPDYQLIRGGFSLVANEDYTWIEHKDRAQGIDIVAIPIEFPDDAIIVTQQQLNLVDDINFEVGSDLFIIGFPYGHGASDFFPIWKRGTVASEPLFKPEGLSRFYIDSLTKPGMSGSPVFASDIRDLIFLKGEAKSNFEKYNRGEASALDVVTSLDADQIAKPVPTKCFQLVGIYSGRIIVHGEQDPNVGIVWHKKLIDELFSQPSIVRPAHH